MDSLHPPVKPPAPTNWLDRLERAIVNKQVQRPQQGDEVLVGESVLVVQYPRQERCGCVPATVGIGREWHPVIRLCEAHASVTRDLFTLA